MNIHTIIYFSIIGIGVGLLAVLLFILRKSAERLPVTWTNSLPQKHLRAGILLLMMHLLLLFLSEFVSFYLAIHQIYNSFAISIGYTLYTPFLFGFLFIYTQTAWKRYSYILLYLILVGYFITGGYYHPDCILPNYSPLLFSSIYFWAALVHLSDLLMNPKLEFFKFQLKVNISILIYNILTSITASLLWSYTDRELPYLYLTYYINLYITVGYYFALDLVFVQKILKLRRRYNHL